MHRRSVFFRLSGWGLGLLLFAAILGPTVLGVLLGRYLIQVPSTR
jgi:hypothetical protein